MQVVIDINVVLKDRTKKALQITVDFLNDPARAQACIIIGNIAKGGYVSLAQVSKLIARASDGNSVVNPIHILTIESTSRVDGEPMSLAQLLSISSQCDCRKIKGVTWVNDTLGKVTVELVNC